jgi:hypothetical protein
MRRLPPPPTPPDPLPVSPLITLAEAARICGVSRTLLASLIRADACPFRWRRLGRRVLVNKASLLAWAEGDEAA